MIEKEELVVGQWYDGFVYYSGKQRGTAVLQWTGHIFHSREGASLYLKDDMGMAHQAEFEPNVRGVKPQ